MAEKFPSLIMSRPEPHRSPRKRQSADTAALDAVYGMVQRATGHEPHKGEDLIADPKLREAYLSAKRAAGR